MNLDGCCSRRPYKQVRHFDLENLTHLRDQCRPQKNRQAHNFYAVWYTNVS